MIFNKVILTEDISLILIEPVGIAIAPHANMHGCQKSLGTEDACSFPHSHLIHFSWQTFMGGRKEAEDHVSNRRPKRGKGSLEQESG